MRLKRTPKFKYTVNIRDNFGRVMDAIGSTKSQIAAQAGISSGSLSAILSHNNPRMAQLQKLSLGLGVSSAYLLRGGDPDPEINEHYTAVEEDNEIILELPDDWSPPMPNVAARVNMLLKQTGKRKIELTRRLGVIPSWLSPILKANNPTVKVVERLAFALGVEPAELVKPVTPRDYGKTMIPILLCNLKSVAAQ